MDSGVLSTTSVESKPEIGSSARIEVPEIAARARNMQKVRRAMGVMLGVSLWIKFKLNTRVHGLLIYTAKAKKKPSAKKS